MLYFDRGLFWSNIRLFHSLLCFKRRFAKKFIFNKTQYSNSQQIINPLGSQTWVKEADYGKSDLFQVFRKLKGRRCVLTATTTMTMWKKWCCMLSCNLFLLIADDDDVQNAADEKKQWINMFVNDAYPLHFGFQANVRIGVNRMASLFLCWPTQTRRCTAKESISFNDDALARHFFLLRHCLPHRNNALGTWARETNFTFRQKKHLLWNANHLIFFD